MPLITVGLPIYNSMPYLREAVASLQAQTVRDFRVLAVVDESSDGSAEFMSTIRDERFRIVFQKRKGLIPTLNQMLREVETPWLMRLDTDDIAYPTRVERTLEYIANYPDTGIFPAIAEYYPPERSVGVFRSSWGTPEELRKLVESGWVLTFCHPSVTLNVQKTLEIGGYEESLGHAEDADLWWRIALKHDIRIIPEKLIGYRHHAGQSTSVSMTQNATTLLYVQYRLLSSIWNLTPLPQEIILPRLEQFVSLRQLLSKQKLRNVNIHLAKSEPLAAVKSGIEALLLAPGYITGRLWDNAFRKRPIVNGIDPRLFLAHRAEFWPSSK